jgi:hypothetical protein
MDPMHSILHGSKTKIFAWYKEGSGSSRALREDVWCRRKKDNVTPTKEKVNWE